MVALKFFEPSEFRKASPSCSIEDMDIYFMLLLDKARYAARVPFVINSAYRSVEYEKSKGRSGSSSHCKGLAIDLRCSNSVNRLKIVKALLSVGFERIGIHKSFIHVDYDKDKQSCVWLYD